MSEQRIEQLARRYVDAVRAIKVAEAAVDAAIRARREAEGEWQRASDALEDAVTPYRRGGAA